MEFDFETPYGCCTKSLVKYMEDKFNSNTSLKITVLMGHDEEMKFKCKIMKLNQTNRGLGIIFEYGCTVLGGVKTKKLINWNRIENEK